MDLVGPWPPAARMPEAHGERGKEDATMDPNACVCNILSALAANASEDALAGLAYLRNWISGGGFTPYGWTKEECAAFVTACTFMAETCR